MLQQAEKNMFRNVLSKTSIRILYLDYCRSWRWKKITRKASYPALKAPGATFDDPENLNPLDAGAPKLKPAGLSLAAVALPAPNENPEAARKLKLQVEQSMLHTNATSLREICAVLLHLQWSNLFQQHWDE